MKTRTAELKSRLEDAKRQLREAEAQARATKEGRDEGARAKLAEAERLALWSHLQAIWLAFQLHRHGVKPDEEACQYVPERDCANCASDLPDCWLEAAGAVADGFLEDYAKERAQGA